jgi:hypothetical protein
MVMMISLSGAPLARFVAVMMDVVEMPVSEGHELFRLQHGPK